MATRGLHVLLFFLLVLMIFPLPCSAEHSQGAKGAGGVVAQVGEVPLSKFDFSLKFQKKLPSQVGYHGKMDEEKLAKIREMVFQDLVDEARQVNWARDQKLQISNDKVNQAMQPLIDRYQNVEGLKEKIGEELYRDLRTYLYREELAKKAREVAVDEKVNISEAQVREYYEANKSRFYRPDQYRISHILIKVDPAARPETRQELRRKAETLLERARAGEDFYNLAYYNSEDRTKFVGGDMGYFHSGQVLKEIEEAVKTMKPGDMSDIVETRFGYHILKLTEHNPPRQMAFDEIREKIQTQLRETQRQSLLDSWMAQLKEGYQMKQFKSLEQAFGKEDDAG